MAKCCVLFFYTCEILESINAFFKMKLCRHTINRVIFAPSKHANGFAPSYIRPRLCTKEIICNIGICPVLNSTADNKGKSDENKKG